MLLNRCHTNSRSLNSNADFVVYINAYLFSYFNSCGKCVRNHIFQNTGIGAATYLNFKVGSIYKSSSPLSLQYLMLNSPSLDGSPICLPSCHLK